MDLIYPLKKLIITICTVGEKVLTKLSYWKISADQNITLGKSCTIDKTAKVQIKHGGKIILGTNCEILEGVLIQTYGGIIQIGDNCSVNAYSVIYGHGNTFIGNNVLIAGGCMIIPSNHKFADKDKAINSQGATSLGIVIEDDVWIGHGCSVLDGVTIGRGAVVAAGSVVNKSIPPMNVVAGVPAKIVKTR